MIRVVLLAAPAGNDQILFIVVLAVSIRIVHMPTTANTANWHAIFLDSHLFSCVQLIPQWWERCRPMSQRHRTSLCSFNSTVVGAMPRFCHSMTDREYRFQFHSGGSDALLVPIARSVLVVFQFHSGGSDALPRTHILVRLKASALADA